MERSMPMAFYAAHIDDCNRKLIIHRSAHSLALTSGQSSQISVAASNRFFGANKAATSAKFINEDIRDDDVNSVTWSYDGDMDNKDDPIGVININIDATDDEDFHIVEIPTNKKIKNINNKLNPCHKLENKETTDKASGKYHTSRLCALTNFRRTKYLPNNSSEISAESSAITIKTNAKQTNPKNNDVKEAAAAVHIPMLKENSVRSSKNPTKRDTLLSLGYRQNIYKRSVPLKKDNSIKIDNKLVENNKEYQYKVHRSQKDSISDIVPPLKIRKVCQTKFPNSYPTRQQYETVKTVVKNDQVFENWLTEKRKLISKELAHRREMAEKEKEKRETRKKLSELSFKLWLESKEGNEQKHYPSLQIVTDACSARTSDTSSSTTATDKITTKPSTGKPINAANAVAMQTQRILSTSLYRASKNKGPMATNLPNGNTAVTKTMQSKDNARLNGTQSRNMSRRCPCPCPSMKSGGTASLTSARTTRSTISAMSAMSTNSTMSATSTTSSLRKYRRNIDEEEIKRRLNEWTLKKKIEEDRKRALQQRIEERKRLIIEERHKLAQVAYQRWIKDAHKKAKPVPMNQGLLSLRGTIASLFVNENEWVSS